MHGIYDECSGLSENFWKKLQEASDSMQMFPSDLHKCSNFTDEVLIATLEKRGYIVTRKEEK